MIHPKLLFPSPLSKQYIYIYTHTCVQEFFGQIVCLKLKWTYPTSRRCLEKTLAKTAVADFSLGAAFFRRTVWEASPKSWVFFPGRGTGCLALAGRGREYHVSPWGPASGCGLCRVKTFQMAFVQLSPGAQMLPAPHLSDPCPALHTCGPPASHPRALREGIRICTSDLHGRVFHMGIGFNSMWLLFPFTLDSGWDSFLSGGSQLPRCCHFLFYISVEEYFSFIFRIFFFFFCHQKNTSELRVPSWLWLNQCWQLNPSCRRSQLEYYIKHCYAHNAALWSNLNNTFLLFILLYIIYINTFAI